MSVSIKKYSLCGIALFSLSIVTPLCAGQLSPSTEVQANIKLLAETKTCPQCDLSGANLNRFDLSGANLEGADLSRAKLFLSNLSGANLRNANLKEAQFGGADLANADLTGADLTGASLVGAYLVGAKLDGEMVATKPYASDDISEVEEEVYVEDTVKPKSIPATEEIAIGTRRDFEETAPVLPPVTHITKEVQETTEVVIGSDAQDQQENTTGSVPGESIAAPAAKSSPVIQNVLIQDPAPDSETVVTDEEKTATTVSPEKIVLIEDEIVSTTVIEEEVIEKQIIEEEGASKETVEEVTVDTPVTGNVEEKPEMVEEVVTHQVNEEDPVIANVISQVTAIEETIAVTVPEKVMLNIERLLDTNICDGCDLSGVNLSGENLESADLEGANLLNAILSGIDLEGANLKGADKSLS